MVTNSRFFKYYILFTMAVASLTYESHLFKNYNIMQMIVSALFVILFFLYYSTKNKKSISKRYIGFIGLFVIMILNNLIAFGFFGKSSMANIASVPLMLFTGLSMFVCLPRIFQDNNNLSKAFLDFIVLFCFALSIISLLLEVSGGHFFIWSKPYATRNASIYYDANFCANILGCGFLVTLMREDINRILKIPVLLLIIYAEYLTGSRGTLLSIVVAGFMYITIFSKMKSYKKIVLILFLLGLCLYAFQLLDKLDYFRTFQGTNNRLEMWLWSLGMIIESPIIGYGYGSIGNYLAASGFVNASTHNSFLDFAFSYGLICLVVYLYLIYKSVISGMQKKNTRVYLLAYLYMLVNSNTILYSLGGVGISSILYTVFMGILFCNESNIDFKQGKQIRNS